MAYSRFIHDYLDGELNDAQKDVLFSQLAQSSELRTEFEQQVKLQSLASLDMSTISAPVDSTNFIFSSLGFSIPSGQQASYWPGFLSSRGSLVAGIILLLTLSSALFFTGNYFGSNGIIEFNDIVGSKNSVPVVTSIDNNDNSIVENINMNTFNKGNYFSNADMAGVTGNTNQLIRNNSVFSSESNNHTQFIVASNDDHSINNESYISIGISPNQIFNTEEYASSENLNERSYSARNDYKAINSSFGSDLMINDPGFYDEWKEIREKKYSININTFMTDAGSYHNIPGQNYGSFSDVSFSIAWNKDENHSFMISGGKEKYPLSYKYNGTTEYQNPDRTWIGLSYRYNVTSMKIIGLIYPYTQMTAGATSIGPVFRPQAGLIMRPSPSLSITFGAEYNVLFYDVSGTKYLSDKFSIAYGLNYHF